MRLNEFSLFLLSLGVFAISCKPTAKQNQTTPAPFSIKVEGPLSIDSTEFGIPDFKLYKYSVEIKNISSEVYISTSHFYSNYWPKASAYIKRVRPDSLVVSSGVSDYVAPEILKIIKGNDYKFYFYDSIRKEKYDSIYFTFSYCKDCCCAESYPVEVKLKYKPLDQ